MRIQRLVLVPVVVMVLDMQVRPDCFARTHSDESYSWPKSFGISRFALFWTQALKSLRQVLGRRRSTMWGHRSLGMETRLPSGQ